MSSVTTTTDERIARGALIDATTQNEPWEASFSRHPMEPVETVTFSSDEVGVLTHFVRIKPRYNAPTGTLHGFKVEKYHQGQEDATIVEAAAGTFEEALKEAKDCIDRLTH